VSALALTILAGRIASRIPAPGARGCAGILGFTAFWSFIDGCLHLFPGHEYVFTQLGYIPTVLSGFGLLVVALDYRQRLHILTPPRVAVLLAVPAVTVVLAFSNEYHGLIWSQFGSERIGGIVYMRVTYGKWFPIHLAWQYILNVFAAGLLIQTIFRSTQIHRRQAILVVLAIVIPWFANLTYMLRVGPAPGLDLTSAAFSVSCVLLTIGIFRYQLFDVVPIAHDSVIQQMSDGVIILDPEGRVLDANPAATNLFRLEGALIGRMPKVEVLTAHGPQQLGMFDSPSSTDVWVEKPGGTRYFDLTISPLRLGSGRIAGRTVVFRDMTVRRLEKEALILSREETAAANDRLSALNEELRTALQRVEALAGEAEAASRVKGEFLAAMSHEIRTPMNAVLGASDLLADTGLTDLQREYNEMVRNAGSTLLSIINDILDLSKAEAGRMETEQAPFPLLNVIDQVVELVEEQAHRKSLVISIDIEEQLHPWVKGDAGRFRQVLLNLLSNAVKFTESGSVEIRVRTVREKMRTRFEVEDTGIGVPFDAQSRLFEVFRQGDASMSRRYGGTGLGLAIARRLVELMGGFIGFESVPEQGSVFWFELPLEPCDPAVSKTSQFDGLTAAVVATPPTRRLLLNRLRTLGMVATAFETAPVAIAKAPESTLLFVEHTMTGRSYVSVNRKSVAETVRIYTPVRLSQLLYRLTALLPPKPDTEPHVQSSPVLTGKRVLLAEDNVVNAHLARVLLIKLGLEVELAGSGTEALDAFVQSRYDLILMDLQMPDMDGLEATRRIRIHEGTMALGHTPIVALTANVLSSEREQCRIAGMDDFVAKPIDRVELGRVVMRWAGSSPVSA